MTSKTNFLKRFWPIGLFILIVIYLVFSWSAPGLPWAGGEEGALFVRSGKFLEAYTYGWREIGTGVSRPLSVSRIPIYILVNYLESIFSLNPLSLQLFIFGLYIFVGLVFAYLSANEILNNKYASFLAAFFYVFNAFSLANIWGRFLLSHMSFVPLFASGFYFALKTLKDRKIIYLILFSTVSVLFSAAYETSSSVIIFWTAISMFWLIVVGKKEFRDSLKWLFALFITWTLVNLWWIIPYYQMQSFIFTVGREPGYNHDVLLGISKTVKYQNVVRLLHAGLVSESGHWGGYFRDFPFNLLSWLIPLFALIGVVNIKKRKIKKYFIVLILLSICFSKGASGITGWLFDFIFRLNPIFGVFRNPFEKGGNLLPFAYFIPVGMGLYVVISYFAKKFKSINKNIFFLISILSLAYLVWPFWTVDIFRTGGGWKNISGQPAYYEELDEYLFSKNPVQRTIQLPVSTSEGMTYRWDPPYSGRDLSEFIFEVPVISIRTKDIYQSWLIAQVPEALEKGLFHKIMAISASSYVFVNKDIDWQYRGLQSTEEVISALSDNSEIDKVDDFGNLELYKLSNGWKLPLIYIPRRVSVIPKGKLIEMKISDLRIDTKLDAVIEGESLQDSIINKAPNLSFTKKDVGNYLITIENATEPFWVVFSSTYHPKWNIYHENGVYLDSHVANGFANAYKIEKFGDYNLYLKYDGGPNYWVNKIF